jgi:hypothetical protein
MALLLQECRLAIIQQQQILAHRKADVGIHPAVERSQSVAQLLMFLVDKGVEKWKSYSS